MASSIDGSSFDFVVVGTGLSESILSAALSIQGHTVLHIDSVRLVFAAQHIRLDMS